MKQAKLVLLVCFFGVLAASQVWAYGYHGPSYPACGFGVSYDSYGRGIDDGFNATNVRAKLLDETCYAWGVTEGKKTRADDTWSFCTTAFNRGRADGYAVEPATDSGCYSPGYKAGEAALDIDAREGNAASNCQDAYNKGVQDVRDGEAGSSPDGNVAAHCYSLGRFDASGLTN